MNQAIINSATRHLRKNDSIMASLIKQQGLLNFSAKKKPHFHTLIRAIINQQLSVKAANTIEKRTRLAQGGGYFNAIKLTGLTSTTLRKCGLSANKVHYILTLSQAVIDNTLNFRSLVRQDDDYIRNYLIQFPGIGLWSAEMFLISSLQRPDIFPVGDLVLRKSIQRHYTLAKTAKTDDYIALSKSWQPYRSIASLYLWKSSQS